MSLQSLDRIVAAQWPLQGVVTILMLWKRLVVLDVLEVLGLGLSPCGS